MPTREDVRKALQAIKRQADYEYFFNQLRSPDWIHPLIEEGFFKNPPEPEKAGNFVRFSFWAESQYLARMASKAPELVMSVVRKIQTNNPRVQEDIIDVSLQVSAKLAAELVPRFIEWIQHRSTDWAFEKLSEVVVHLVRGSQLDSAFALTKELLWFDPDPDIEEKKSRRGETTHLFKTSPQPQARCQDWIYKKVSDHVIPTLLQADPFTTIQLLSLILDRSIQLSRLEETDLQYDGSIYWRPAIETQEQNWIDSTQNLVVNIIRDSCESVIESNFNAISNIDAILESYKWDIFKRIRLHILRRFPEATAQQIQNALIDYRLFSGYEFNHEYVLLLEQEFGGLPDALKKTILGWIEKGPDEELLKSFATDWDGNPASSELFEKRINAWKAKELKPIKQHLSLKWRDLYNQLVEIVGEPRNPEFGVHHSAVWTGPTSPKSQEDLLILDAHFVLEFLRSWQPTKGWTEPTPEGLARAFQQTVKQKAEDYSTLAIEFQDIEPAYVRALFSGLSEAVKAETLIEWKPVLDLAIWVIEQPILIPGRVFNPVRFEEGDPSWAWTRKSIAGLLRDGCRAGKTEISFELRESVWKILKELTNDPDPTVDYEENRAGSFGPATLSINTTRGESMHAIFADALWVKRHLGSDKRQSGFEVIPEVAEVLDDHLNLNIEPTLTIRSVYGQNLLVMIQIDREWFKERETIIFPTEEYLRNYWAVAWNTYVIFNNCYHDIYKILEKQYRIAVSRLNEPDEIQREVADSKESLTQHLMILYWQGEFGLDSDILSEFYFKASDDLRARAIDFIGRSLKNTTGEIPSLAMQRLMTLWQWRFDAITSNKKNAATSKEIAAFVMWFWSEKFDDKWVLEQLVAVIKITQDVEREFFIMDRLVHLSRVLPIQTLACLELLILSINRRKGYFSSTDKAREILENVIAQPNSEARAKAKETANLFLSLRYSEFRDIAEQII